MNIKELRARGLAWVGDGVPSKLATKRQRDARRARRKALGISMKVRAK